MRFYVSKCHNRLNGYPYAPESVTPYLCLNPYYSVTLNPEMDVRYILDSGAFQDVRSESRLSFREALDRQLLFENKVGRKAEAIVSYDRLVDEQVNETGQFKKRVDHDTGAEFVEETLKASEFLVSRRSELEDRQLILSCQGTSITQYIGCVESMLEIAQPGDIIGLGGFCILSKNMEYEKEFYEVIMDVFPKIHQRGIDRVHIFGMGTFRALVQADVLARMNDIELSYDTSSPEMNSVYGKVFNPIYWELSGVFSKNHKNSGYIPSDLAILNVKMVVDFWDRMREMPLPDSFVPSLKS